MELETQVQIPDKPVSISFCINALEKGIKSKNNKIVFHPWPIIIIIFAYKIKYS